MKYLITQSLLSAWAYQFDCVEGYEEEARESFLRTLRREKEEPTDAMLNGIEFENAVYATAAGTMDPTGHKWEKGIQKVAKYLKNAPVQVKVSSDIRVDGMDFLLYGILDALKAGTIYDVKFLNKSIGSAELAGKYLESAQHPAYFYLVPDALAFRYLVSDGEDIYIESYLRQDTRYIGDYIHDFLLSITTDGLLDTYKEYWQAQEG